MNHFHGIAFPKLRQIAAYRSPWWHTALHFIPLSQMNCIASYVPYQQYNTVEHHWRWLQCNLQYSWTSTPCCPIAVSHLGPSKCLPEPHITTPRPRNSIVIVFGIKVIIKNVSPQFQNSHDRHLRQSHDQCDQQMTINISIKFLTLPVLPLQQQKPHRNGIWNKSSKICLLSRSCSSSHRAIPLKPPSTLKSS